jgi:ABC-type branched-subunit amino acid transport system substrate-binding protein
MGPRKFLIFLLFTTIFLGFESFGQTLPTIDIGVSNAKTGPNGYGGNLLSSGMYVAFDSANKSGGVNSQQIRVIHYDDQLEPKLTIQNINKLIDVDHVLFLALFSGSAPTKAVLPIIEQKKIPLLFPRAGDEFLRQSNLPIFNLRPSYNAEVQALVAAAVKKKKLKFSILLSHDQYSEAIRLASLTAFHTLGINQGLVKPFICEATIPRNSEDATDAFKQMEQCDTDVVILAAGPASSAPFINLAEKNKKPWLFLANSSLESLLTRVGDTKSTDILISQGMPDPLLDQIPLAAKFRKEMKRAGHEDLIKHTSFEGYIDALVIIEMLKRAGPNPTREKIVEGLVSKPFKIGGLTLQWSTTDHSNHGKVYLTKIRNGKFVVD